MLFSRSTLTPYLGWDTGSGNAPSVSLEIDEIKKYTRRTLRKSGLGIHGARQLHDFIIRLLQRAKRSDFSKEVPSMASIVSSTFDKNRIRVAGFLKFLSL